MDSRSYISTQCMTSAPHFGEPELYTVLLEGRSRFPGTSPTITAFGAAPWISGSVDSPSTQKLSRNEYSDTGGGAGVAPPFLAALPPVALALRRSRRSKN